MPSVFWNVPNVLSLSRLPLTVVLCACVSFERWTIGLITFCIAAFTDWLDGWWARRFNQLTPVGRALDPLTDKVIIGSAFIFLIPVAEVGVAPWVVALVIIRELLITGLRGMVEATGRKFGADWFGKLKTVLQSAVLIGALLLKTLDANAWLPHLFSPLVGVYWVLLWAMLIATVGSGLQYGWKAAKMLSQPLHP
jgi:CDP-diacylglycerol--glycerol-3-phosphate 3-phosphatidyltransferase